ncbi:MAG: hypothetical protein O3C57_03130, partial [Verrucomicrobia bacterium]|nr:hypothetical protein [Verrucomicrobiota bacterium]
MHESISENGIQSKRKLKRYSLIAFLPITEMQSGDQIGHVIDINTEGFGLTCAKKFEIGELYALRVGLPDEILGEMSFTVEVRCRWASDQAQSGLCLAGFMFEGLLPDTIEIIE